MARAARRVVLLLILVVWGCAPKERSTLERFQQEQVRAKKFKEKRAAERAEREQAP